MHKLSGLIFPNFPVCSVCRFTLMSEYFPSKHRAKVLIISNVSNTTQCIRGVLYECYLSRKSTDDSSRTTSVDSPSCKGHLFSRKWRLDPFYLQINWAFGSCFEVLMAAYILPRWGWRYLVGVSALPMFITIFSIWVSVLWDHFCVRISAFKTWICLWKIFFWFHATFLFCVVCSWISSLLARCWTAKGSHKNPWESNKNEQQSSATRHTYWQSQGEDFNRAMHCSGEFCSVASSCCACTLFSTSRWSHWNFSVKHTCVNSWWCIFQSSRRGHLVDLFKYGYFRTTVQVWLLWFVTAFSYYGNVLLSTEILEKHVACGACEFWHHCWRQPYVYCIAFRLVMCRSVLFDSH